MCRAGWQWFVSGFSLNDANGAMPVQWACCSDAKKRLAGCEAE